ncbi:hypothetical protein [Pseudomaricurvus sp.]|uniref:hypothetical protein n=1 Tax=Pseudomaricurvus sp. TaxID=2004510 RepID=UPI003F6D4D63
MITVAAFVTVVIMETGFVAVVISAVISVGRSYWFEAPGIKTESLMTARWRPVVSLMFMIIVILVEILIAMRFAVALI